MNRIVMVGFLSLACGIGQPAIAGKPDSDAIVDSSKKPGSFLATKDESKDFRVSQRSQKRKQSATKDVFLRPRLTLELPTHKLPWAPNAPGD